MSATCLISGIPSAQDLTLKEWSSLRDIVVRSFTPTNQVAAPDRMRLLQLGLVRCGMGGLTPTPAGRIVARL